MKRTNITLWLCALLCLSGCALENRQLTHFDPRVGYRLRNLPTNSINSDEVFIVLSFSGGGTRAAAFSYGTLAELAATPIRSGNAQRHLLDEVDLISSVSGGSFTAAYYALYRDRLFRDFRKEFLTRNVQLSLFLGVLNPINWPRLASPYFDRIDLAAEHYDRILFKGQTYGTLVTNATRPFIVVNATDMSLGSRFEFTQEQFDLISSDLGTYPLARAVAASSAFPGLLSPLTLKNYPAATNYTEPGWITSGLQDAEENGRRFKLATLAQTYEDPKSRPYLHLLDGGLSDNIGLRGPSRALLSNDGEGSILNRINTRRIKKVAVIAVNAKAGLGNDWDSKRRAPGLLGVFSTVTSAPMDNYSLETIDSLKENIDQIVKDKQTEKAVIAKLKALCPEAVWKNLLPDVQFYDIELSFDKIKDPETRQKVKALPTSFHLNSSQVELLERAAKDLLLQSDQYQKLVKDLN